MHLAICGQRATATTPWKHCSTLRSTEWTDGSPVDMACTPLSAPTRGSPRSAFMSCGVRWGWVASRTGGSCQVQAAVSASLRQPSGSGGAEDLRPDPTRGGPGPAAVAAPRRPRRGSPRRRGPPHQLVAHGAACIRSVCNRLACRSQVQRRDRRAGCSDGPRPLGRLGHDRRRCQLRCRTAAP